VPLDQPSDAPRVSLDTLAPISVLPANSDDVVNRGRVRASFSISSGGRRACGDLRPVDDPCGGALRREASVRRQHRRHDDDSKHPATPPGCSSHRGPRGDRGWPLAQSDRDGEGWPDGQRSRRVLQGPAGRRRFLPETGSDWLKAPAPRLTTTALLSTIHEGRAASIGAIVTDDPVRPRRHR